MSSVFKNLKVPLKIKSNVFQISVLEGSSALRKRDTSPQSGGTGGGGKQVGFSTCQYDSLEEEQIPPAVPSTAAAGRTGSCHAETCPTTGHAQVETVMPKRLLTQRFNTHQYIVALF